MIDNNIGAAADLSFANLFMQADYVVKFVMATLAVASLGCWTIIIDKLIRLMGMKRRARLFETVSVAGNEPGRQEGGSAERIVSAGRRAHEEHDISESRAERRERIERAMRMALSIDMRRLQPGLAFLATTGSAAPFVGLFGTVWGIMNSFTAISKTQETSLSVVAPGIAEALFATAIGLAAAIPAVIAYNKLTTDIGRVQQSFLAGISALSDRLSRSPHSSQPGSAE